MKYENEIWSLCLKTSTGKDLGSNSLWAVENLEERRRCFDINVHFEASWVVNKEDQPFLSIDSTQIS